MAFFKDRSEKIEREFMNHVSDEVKLRYKNPDPITLQEYEKFRGNSYERKLLLPKMDNETLIHQARHCLNFANQHNFRQLGKYEIARHYDQALSGDLIHMLIDRLEQLTAEITDK